MDAGSTPASSTGQLAEHLRDNPQESPTLHGWALFCVRRPIPIPAAHPPNEPTLNTPKKVFDINTLSVLNLAMTTQSPRQQVAANIRAEMARRQHTQNSLAAEVGMRQQALSRRLSGQTPFTIDELAQISAALGIALTELVGAA